MEYLFAFQFWCCECYMENRWGGGRKHWFVDFYSVDEGWKGRKPYLDSAEIASFSSQDFIQSNKHDIFWHVVSTGYFYILFLWAIAVSDFRPLEIYKNLSLPLSTITFKVNSHADNYFYLCTFRFWPRIFIFKFDLNLKHCSYFF